MFPIYFQEENTSVLTKKIDLNEPVTVRANREYVLQVKLTQINKRKDLKVFAPRFSKPKDESWFLTLGEIRSKELLALKRFTFGRRKEVFHNFVYQVPDKTGILNVILLFTRMLYETYKIKIFLFSN